MIKKYLYPNIFLITLKKNKRQVRQQTKILLKLFSFKIVAKSNCDA